MRGIILICLWCMSLYSAPLSHIVLLSDIHLPGNTLSQKEAVRENINHWSDLSMVVTLGDLTQESGTNEEYETVKAYFGAFTKPVYAINGNHDYIYTDGLDEKGHHRKANREEQNRKLSHFQEIFHLEKPYYTRLHNGYLLVFLSANHAKFLTGLDEEELVWFKRTLSEHPKTPTIVFFHGPLDHTLNAYNKNANTPNFIAQPKEELDAIIKANPQLFLWVSGHTHTTPKEESFASSINWYNDHLLNLHNPDMTRKTIWTNSLFLYHDKIVIRTYDHTAKKWLDQYDRTLTLPKF